MKQIRWYAWAGIFAVLLMYGGCQTGDTSPGQHIVSSENDESSLELKDLEEKTCSVWCSETLVPDGMDDIGVIAGNENELYYTTVRYVPMGTMDAYTQVYQYSPSGGKLIYEIGDSAHLLNEMVALDDGLFWALNQNGRTQLQRYDLKDGSCTVIREWPNETLDYVIILCGQGQWLTWYEMGQEGAFTLYGYEDNSKEIFAIEEVELYSPYTRHVVHEGITAFVRERDEAQELCVFDLAQREIEQTLPLTEEGMVRWMGANKQYVFYVLGGEEQTFRYVSRTEDGSQVKEWTENGYQVFSCALMKDMLVINERSSGEIVVLSLADKSRTPVTKELAGRHAFVLGTCAGEKQYIALDGESIICISMEE